MHRQNGTNRIIIGPRSKFYTKDPQVLGATVQKLVAWDL